MRRWRHTSTTCSPRAVEGTQHIVDLHGRPFESATDPLDGEVLVVRPVAPGA
jgi:hypothetical protein